MKSFTVTAALLAAIIALLFVFPEILLNPGPLIRSHQPLENRCLSCHKPFSGASGQCAGCHKPSEIGIKNVAGHLLSIRNSRALFHRTLSVTSCVRCHTEHKGRQPKYSMRTFMHDSLSVTLKNDCLACHAERKPADTLHRTVSDACATCHSADKWTNAVFDHSRLPESGQECLTCHRKAVPANALHRQTAIACSSCHNTTHWKVVSFDHDAFIAASLNKKNCLICHADRKPSDSLHRLAGDACVSCHRTDKWSNAVYDHARFAASGQACATCHKKDIPENALHDQISSGCSGCHGTTRWKPAVFDHSRYFWLDRDHRASCSTCHTVKGNYKLYTCMGCHEHSPSRIAGEHLEEGIRNYNDCIKCHRSGSNSHDLHRYEQSVEEH